jgi:alkylation response protein AidB-like acyl-CoA dehydrogenase
MAQLSRVPLRLRYASPPAAVLATERPDGRGPAGSSRARRRADQRRRSRPLHPLCFAPAPSPARCNVASTEVTMFDFSLPDELALIVETTRELARSQLAVHVRDAEEARGVAPEVAARFSETGLAALELPASLDGAGLGCLARALVNEELGAADPGAALALDPLGPALYPVLEAGGEAAVREHLLPLLARPGARALLVTAHDARLETRGDRLRGLVPWVPAERADLLVYLTDDEVLLAREGITAKRVKGAGLRAAGASELTLDAKVVARFLDGEAVGEALARARLYTASLLLGVLRQTAEASRSYAMSRVAFGKPIAHHQALAFLIADMRSAVDGARVLIHEAAWHLDEGNPAESLAAAAFAEAIEASTFVGPNGIQIYGGHGFMQDYPVEKHMREARALGLLLGGFDAAREDAGEHLCAMGGPVTLSLGER